MRLAPCLLAALALCAPLGAWQEPGWQIAGPSIELIDLADSCSALLGVEVLYQPSDLAGAVAVRIDRGMSADELWMVFHQALASKGLTTVQLPGSRALQVVQVASAAPLARLEESSLIGSKAGFIKVLVPLDRVKPEEVGPALNLLLSKSGAITNARGGFLLADQLTHARQVLAAVRILDTAPAPQSITEVRLKHTSAVGLTAFLDRIAQATKASGAEPPKGTLLANPERRSILVVSDEADRAFWEERIRQFDRPQEAYSVAYTPRRFGVGETAKLLEQSVPHQDLPWRVVLDELTGSVVLSTTADLHMEAKALFERLESQALGPRRSVRAFELRRRSVGSVARLVEDLVQRGALAGLAPEGTGGAQGGKETAAIATPGPRPANEGSADLVITLDEPANRLVAFGEGRLLDQLGVLIESLDVAAPQVLVEALVVSLTDTKTRQLGVELRRVAQEGSSLFELASLFGLGAPSPLAPAIPSVSASGATGVVLAPGDFSALVRALETVNDGRVMTVPKVLVSNNEQATLGSTLQTPYVSTNASNTVATTSFGGSLDAGTTISIKPQIAAGDQLVVTYSVSVSTFVGESAAPELPPPRQENRVASVATVPDGFAVVIGGLEVESDTRSESRVPWLGAIPVLGQLFRSESKTRQKSRFFVFLKCSVLRGDRLEDLKYASRAPLEQAGLDDGFPRLEPRVMR